MGTERLRVRREIEEEAHVHAEINALAAVNMNLTASRLIFDLTSTWVSGEPAPSDETPKAEWISSDHALAKVEHPMYRKRLEHLLGFDGQVIYRSYTTEPYKIIDDRIL